jgi:hypothetical protein
MTEQALQERAAERRAEAAARQLSDQVRESPMGQLLARAGAGVEYQEALALFVADQWELHEAKKELKGSNDKRAREESQEE